MSIFNPLSWITDWLNNNIANTVRDMIAKIGGAIETGLIAALGDIWKVIEPAVEIIGGLLIIILTLSIGLRGMIPGVPGAGMAGKAISA